MKKKFTRSFTHPLSNTVVLDKLELSESLPNVLVGKLPIKVLPVLLHEVTHNWCFNSPVGLALALLALNTRSKLLMIEEFDSETKNRLVTDEIKYNLTISLLLPILEGLSEFAEFDLLPTTSPIMSMTSVAAISLFMGKDSKPDSYLEDFIYNVRKCRMQKIYTDRKQSIFCHSFDCLQSSYLSGYLFIKSQFHFASSDNDKFKDTDFFLHYYRSYIFDDWELTRLLLRPNTDTLEDVVDISNYIKERIFKFLNLDHSIHIKNFEEKVIEKKSCSYNFKHKKIKGGFVSFPVDGRCINDEIEHFFDERIDNLFCNYENDSEDLEFLIQNIIGFRGALHLGFGEFWVEVNEYNILEIYDTEKKLLLVRKEVSPEIAIYLVGIVEIEILQSPNIGEVYIIISKEGVTITGFSNKGKLIDDDILRFFIGRNKIIDAMKALNSEIKKLDNNNYKIFSAVLRDFKEQYNDIYCYYPLIYHSNTESRNEARSVLFNNGFSSVFKDDNILSDCVLATFLAANTLNAKDEKFQNFWQNTNIEDSIKVINNKLFDVLGVENFQIFNIDEKLYIHSKLL